MATRESLVTPTPATGVAGTERNQNLPRSYFFTGDGAIRRDLTPRELCDVLLLEKGALWVDVDTTNRHQVATLEKVFGFHPLALEDTLNPNSRVKLEEYDTYLFLIVRGVKFCDTTADDPYDLETFNLSIFLGRNFLVTAHGEQAMSLATVAERLNRSPDLLSRGPERLAHAIIDAEIDAYFPIMDQIDEFVDGLEERVFKDFDRNALHEIFTVKRLVLTLRRHLAPQREVFNILTNRPNSLLTRETQVYFRDVYDHVLRINDSLENYRELLSSVLDAYLTQVSNKLGNITKGLSIIATLSVPFVVISGMWGMNFTSVPLATHPDGFMLMLALQLGIGLGLLVMLRMLKLL